MKLYRELAKQDPHLFGEVFNKLCSLFTLQEKKNVIRSLGHETNFENLYEAHVLNAKKCSNCGLIKHVTDYYRDLHEKDSYRYECKVCTNTRRKNNGKI